jgi:hypothetical protein
MTRSCNRCRSATGMTVLEPISGETKGLTVSVAGMPVLVCPQGHRQFTGAEFAIHLLETVLEKTAASVPAAGQQGRLIKHSICAECGVELHAKPDRDHTLALDVSLPEGAPFRVDLTLPVYRCGQCGTEQMHSRKEVRSQVATALGHAFQHGQIVPG